MDIIYGMDIKNYMAMVMEIALDVPVIVAKQEVSTHEKVDFTEPKPHEETYFSHMTVP